MAKNICPNCHGVILSLGKELYLKCLKCLVMFRVVDCDKDEREEEVKNA